MICPQKQWDFGTSSPIATSQDPQVCLHHSHYFSGNPLNPSLSSPWATYATVWANTTGPREPRCYRGLSPPARVPPKYLLHLPCVQQSWLTASYPAPHPDTAPAHSTPCPQLLHTQASESTGLLTFLQLPGPRTQEVLAPPTAKATVP